jgi:predicted GIY-YIG superfamily endonuclease
MPRRFERGRFASAFQLRAAAERQAAYFASIPLAGAQGRREDRLEAACVAALRVCTDAAFFHDLDREVWIIRAACRAFADRTPPPFPIPDLQGLKDALLESGLRVKSISVPPCREERFFNALSPWLVALHWIAERIEHADEYLFKVHRNRVQSRREPACSPVAGPVVVWLDRHADFIEFGFERLRMADVAIAVGTELFAKLKARSTELERRRGLRLAALDVEQSAVREARMVRARRRKRPDYEAKREAGVIQGFIEFRPGFFFGRTALTQPRWTYVLLGEDGAMYGGSTNNLRRRLREHRSGTGAVLTSIKAQRWWLLHAERHSNGQIGNSCEAALLHSQAVQDALLARAAPRALRLHDRHGCAVPWLDLPRSRPSTNPQGSPERRAFDGP